jgi:HEAT repeat protein
VSAGRIFLLAGVGLVLACGTAVAVIVIAKLRRGRVVARSAALLAPYRLSLLMMASGEDVDGEAMASLCAVPADVWSRLRPGVVALLPKVRGLPADDLGELMRAHGEVDKAAKMLSARSVVDRARAAYLLGLVRDPDSVPQVVRLLDDPAPDARLVAARALGTVGDPSAATGVLRGLRTRNGEIGLPAWVAAEALLAMGSGIGAALQGGLSSDDPAVRNVCIVVAGHGNFYATAPQLRILLATDSDGDVRAAAAVALGRVGGVEDVAALARHSDACELTGLRRTCVAALGELGHREGLEILAGLLGDDDRRLAELAADSLARMGTEGIARLEEEAAVRGQGPKARAATGALELAGLRGQVVTWSGHHDLV